MNENISRIETEVNINYIDLLTLDIALLQNVVVNPILIDNDGIARIKIKTDKKFYALPKTNILMYDETLNVFIKGGYFYPVQNNNIVIRVLRSGGLFDFFGQIPIAGVIDFNISNSFPITLSNIVDNSLIQQSNCRVDFSGIGFGGVVLINAEFATKFYGNVNIDDQTQTTIIYGYDIFNDNQSFTVNQTVPLTNMSANRFKKLSLFKDTSDLTQFAFLETPDNFVFSNNQVGFFGNLKIDANAGRQIDYISGVIVF